MTGPEFGLDEQSQYIEAAVQGVIQAAPENWSELKYTFRATIGTDSSILVVRFQDGSEANRTVPMPVPDAMDDLRRAMYQENVGTWFTATIKIDSSQKYQTDFDYDSEPDFVPPLAPGSYAEDLEHFPRSEENTPDWLRQKVTQAQADS